GTALCAHIDDFRVIGMGGNGPDGRGLRQTACDQFPFVVTHGHTVQARFDDAARGSLARQAHIHIGRVVRCHSSFLLAGSMPSEKPAVYWLGVFHQKAPGMSIPELTSLSLTLALALHTTDCAINDSRDLCNIHPERVTYEDRILCHAAWLRPCSQGGGGDGG